MKFLVVFGTRNGGTEGLAKAAAEALEAEGFDVEVQRARVVDDLTGIDAVIVGGALYAGHWHKDARRFVKWNADALRTLPVWFFSSGPLDDSASQSEIAPTPQVQALMNQVSARGHATFGGRLAADADSWLARMMVKQGKGGDWRDFGRVKAWATALARELAEERRAPAASTSAAAPSGEVQVGG